jgi:membrane protein implicated in regulation of membrane protease activity
MDWSAATWWWIGAGLLVAVELATGTFYLLMVSLGMAAAAVAAHLGMAITWQVVIAALVGGGATAIWHVRRAHEPRSAPAQSNRDVNLDIGETLRIDAWEPDRTARVTYRGAGWTAVFRGDTAPTPGVYKIVEISGNRLVVSTAGSL